MDFEVPKKPQPGRKAVYIRYYVTSAAKPVETSAPEVATEPQVTPTAKTWAIFSSGSNGPMVHPLLLSHWIFFGRVRSWLPKNSRGNPCRSPVLVEIMAALRKNLGRKQTRANQASKGEPKHLDASCRENFENNRTTETLG